MAVSVFINFNGNCREAVEFYKNVFGCDEPKFMTYGDMPPNQDFPALSDEQKKLILYTELKISDSVIMLSDTTPFMHFVEGNNVNITVSSKDMDQLKTWFERMKDGAAVHMELQKTFWSDCYGMLVDKFGIPWQLSHESNK